MSNVHQPPETFETIDPIEFFKEHVHDSRWCRKTSKVRARPASTGEMVVTILEGICETSNMAQDGDMVVMNPGGETYLVTQQIFDKKYKKQDDRHDAAGFASYSCIAHSVQCLCLDRNVEFMAPWGHLMRIMANGFLIRSHENDVYGVQPEAFIMTYAFCAAP